MTFPRRLVVALTSALAALVALTAAVPAQQAAKPAPQCGVQITDKKGDHNETTGDTDDEDVNLDIITGWFAYDAAKGDKAVTANLLINDLSDRTPSGSTGMVWNFVYVVGEETRFVRTLIDFSGTYYEYGTYIPVSDTNPLARYQYDGGTEGQMVEGPDGVVTMVVPKAAGAEAGKELKTPFATASASKQALPGAVPSPTRGLSTAIDTAPDNGEPGVGGKLWKVGPCPADGSVPAGSAPPPPGTPSAPPAAPTPAPAPPASPRPGTQEQVSGPLPVKVLTKKAKRLKKGKRLAIKLSSKERITGLAAQLRKGSKVVAKGKLAQLSGRGTLKLKLSAKLGRGRYILDLAGSDARGAHRLTQARLTVR